MTTKQMTTTKKNDVMREKYLTPSVDIFETEEALTLVADLPGVTKEHLDIGVDQDILTIKGSLDTTASIFSEYECTGYYRQFRLTEHFDQAKANAELKNGVLTLTLPKMEAAKPRRIEVTVH